MSFFILKRAWERSEYTYAAIQFPGTKAGDQWCVCALRWVEAYKMGRLRFVWQRLIGDATDCTAGDIAGVAVDASTGISSVNPDA